MQRQKRARFGSLWAVSLFAGLLAACGGAQNVQPGNGVATNAAGAAITAAAAGAVWAAGGGCRVQDCPYGTFCDQKSGYCKVRKCSEGCPDGTVCNEGLDRCQAAPPPRAPNDFLPQDNKVTNPPGTH